MEQSDKNMKSNDDCERRKKEQEKNLWKEMLEYLIDESDELDAVQEWRNLYLIEQSTLKYLRANKSEDSKEYVLAVYEP